MKVERYTVEKFKDERGNNYDSIDDMVKRNVSYAIQDKIRIALNLEQFSRLDNEIQTIGWIIADKFVKKETTKEQINSLFADIDFDAITRIVIIGE